MGGSNGGGDDVCLEACGITDRDSLQLDRTDAAAAMDGREREAGVFAAAAGADKQLEDDTCAAAFKSMDEFAVGSCRDHKDAATTTCTGPEKGTGAYLSWALASNHAASTFR